MVILPPQGNQNPTARTKYRQIRRCSSEKTFLWGFCDGFIKKRGKDRRKWQEDDISVSPATEPLAKRDCAPELMRGPEFNKPQRVKGIEPPEGLPCRPSKSKNRGFWIRLEPNGAGEGNRTLVFSLEGCCSTIELHPLDGGAYASTRCQWQDGMLRFGVGGASRSKSHGWPEQVRP